MISDAQKAYIYDVLSSQAAQKPSRQSMKKNGAVLVTNNAQILQAQSGCVGSSEAGSFPPSMGRMQSHFTESVSGADTALDDSVSYSYYLRF